MNLIRYVFYKLFLLHRKGFNNNDFVCAIYAVVSISVLFYFNIYTLGAFLSKTDIIPHFITKHSEVIGAGIIIALNGFNFVIPGLGKKFSIIAGAIDADGGFDFIYNKFKPPH